MSDAYDVSFSSLVYENKEIAVYSEVNRSLYFIIDFQNNGWSRILKSYADTSGKNSSIPSLHKAEMPVHMDMRKTRYLTLQASYGFEVNRCWWPFPENKNHERENYHEKGKQTTKRLNNKPLTKYAG